MSFTCDCELQIDGGGAADRRAAADIVLAAECVRDGGATRRETADSLAVRFPSEDGLPEDELAAAAPQFPGLSFTLVYFSRDGEFYGYARASEKGEADESEDLDESALETLGSKYGGNGIAFVRAAFGLEPSA
jgi:hypothetical protein